MSEVYSYRKSLKSDISDEPINVYLLRPLAGLLVKALYNTSVTPNQVTIAAVFVGVASAILYSLNSPLTTLLAGLTLTLKDLLDSADGQLARAKELYSRAGRFLDSIGDFVVNLMVFGVITGILISSGPLALMLVLGILGFLGISFRVSYHVFYHTAFLHIQNQYSQNRLTEEIEEKDRAGDRFALRLQSIYRILYGWQDGLMMKLDRWCRNRIEESGREDGLWYGDKLGLRFTGLLGMGTELFVLTMCSLANQLMLYLYLNIFLLNSIWLGSIMYRRLRLASRLQRNP